MKGPLQPGIAHEGQAYVDEPIQVKPKRQSILTSSVEKALDPNNPGIAPLTIGYQRVRLKWIKPSNTPST